ncbi:ABC transporter substrate-binding protein [Actinomadura sp. LOL_016]|uniref:ABC transporter substrate-binding protein n=1 Tax=unclassified Actinomadura TaxID=2626254 RepID=UPI003A801085
MQPPSRSLPTRLVALLVASLALVAAACSGGTGGGGTGSAPVDAAKAADRSAEFRFAISIGMNSLDPHRPINPSDSIWMRPVYDSLLTLANGAGGVEIAPQLATSYTVARDGRSIEFVLRDDVTFQNGGRFDAEAAAANLERATGPDSTIAGRLDAIDRVEVAAPTRVVLHLSHPDPGLPWTLADSSAGMMVDPAAFGTDLKTRPAGSGPYRLVSAAKDADVVYRRWDGHWNRDAALASKLTITTVRDANARFNGVRSGQYDAANMSTPLDSVSKPFGEQGFHWEQALSPISYGVLLNSDIAPFDDVRVRRAVHLAVNRADISQKVLRGLNPPSYQVFNKGYLGHDPKLDKDPHDLGAARALVREAGAQGAAVTVVQVTTAPHDTLAQVVQQALTDIGLKVQLLPKSATESHATWREGRYQAQVGTILAYADPAQTLDSTYLGTSNHGPADPALEKKARDALALPVGGPEREKAYREIGAHLIENPVHVPIVQFSTVVLARPDVVGSENLVVQDIGKLDLRRVGATGR